jgi:hypothetical protein
MIDGYNAVPWDDLDDNPFVEENLRRGKSKKKERTPRSVVNGQSSESTSERRSAPDKGPTRASLKAPEKEKILKRSKRMSSNEGASTSVSVNPPDEQKPANFCDTVIVDVFPKEVISAVSRLFTIKLEPGESIGEMDLPSTNILCVVVKHYCDFLLENSLVPEDKDEIAFEGQVSFTDRHWLIRAIRGPKGKEWYLAEFVGTAMPFLSIKKRGGKLAGWICQGHTRPTNAKQAMACIPPNLVCIPCYATKIAFSECELGKAVFFESVEMALRMEAAFWLERQFGESSRHWYQQTLQEMMTKATTLETVMPRDD